VRDTKEIGLEGVKLIQLAQDRTSVGCFEQGNETLVSVKCGKFLGIRIWLFLKKDSGP
jgi:hypothetical protein